MATDRTRLIVRKTLEQLKAEKLPDGTTVAQIYEHFEQRLDFNLDLAGIPKVTGRKPKAKAKSEHSQD